MSCERTVDIERELGGNNITMDMTIQVLDKCDWWLNVIVAIDVQQGNILQSKLLYGY